MSFKQHEQADRRLHILRLLLSADYAMPHPVIISALYDYGHTIGTDGIHTDIQDLQELGLLNSEKQGVTTVVALTQQGVDVGMGRTVIEGVRRPTVDEIIEIKEFMEKHHGS